MDTVRDVLLPLASGIMIGCIVISLVALSYAFGSTWHADYLVPLSALVAIESYFSVRADAGIRMRIVELGIIYAVLEAADSLANGSTLRAALTPHFNQPILIGGIVLLFVWLGVREMADQLPEIHKSLEPSSVVGSLALRFVAGGVFLFFIAGLTQRSLARTLHLSSSSPSGTLLNVLVYFLIGMLVVSYLQFQSMHQRWEIQQVRVVGDVQASWLRLTAGLLVLALLLAVILPTTQVFGLTELIAAIGKALAGLGLGIWNHLPGHGAAPPPSRIFGHGHHPPPTPVATTRHSPGSPPPSWLDAVRTALFWSVLAGGLVYMLFRVSWTGIVDARPRRGRRSVIARLARLWRRLWGRARRTAGRVAALVPRSMPRRPRGAPGGPARRFLRLNALSPEEQVRYFYLSLVRRAQAQGISRSPSQTPREFAARLSPMMGEAEPDLQALTDAFIEARYSGRPMERARLTRIKAHWQRVRHALHSAAVNRP